jgi:hypothetical protein
MTGTDCGLFTHKSVPVIFESPCILYVSIFHSSLLFAFFFVSIAPFLLYFIISLFQRVICYICHNVIILAISGIFKRRELIDYNKETIWKF